MSGHFTRRAFSWWLSMMCLVPCPVMTHFSSQHHLQSSTHLQILGLCTTSIGLISSSPFKSVQLLFSICLVTFCSARLCAICWDHGDELGAVPVLKADQADGQYLPGVVVAQGVGANSLGGPRILQLWCQGWASGRRNRRNSGSVGTEEETVQLEQATCPQVWCERRRSLGTFVWFNITERVSCDMNSKRRVGARWRSTLFIMLKSLHSFS